MMDRSPGEGGGLAMTSELAVEFGVKGGIMDVAGDHPSDGADVNSPIAVIDATGTSGELRVPVHEMSARQLQAEVHRLRRESAVHASELRTVHSAYEGMVAESVSVDEVKRLEDVFQAEIGELRGQLETAKAKKGVGHRETPQKPSRQFLSLPGDLAVKVNRGFVAQESSSRPANRPKQHHHSNQGTPEKTKVARSRSVELVEAEEGPAGEDETHGSASSTSSTPTSRATSSIDLDSEVVYSSDESYDNPAAAWQRAPRQTASQPREEEVHEPEVPEVGMFDSSDDDDSCCVDGEGSGMDLGLAAIQPITSRLTDGAAAGGVGGSRRKLETRAAICQTSVSQAVPQRSQACQVLSLVAPSVAAASQWESCPRPHGAVGAGIVRSTLEELYLEGASKAAVGVQVSSNLTNAGTATETHVEDVVAAPKRKVSGKGTQTVHDEADSRPIVVAFDAAVEAFPLVAHSAMGTEKVMTAHASTEAALDREKFLQRADASVQATRLFANPNRVFVVSTPPDMSSDDEALHSHEVAKEDASPAEHVQRVLKSIRKRRFMTGKLVAPHLPRIATPKKRELLPDEQTRDEDSEAPPSAIADAAVGSNVTESLHDAVAAIQAAEKRLEETLADQLEALQNAAEELSQRRAHRGDESEPRDDDENPNSCPAGSNSTAQALVTTATTVENALVKSLDGLESRITAAIESIRSSESTNQPAPRIVLESCMVQTEERNVSHLATQTTNSSPLPEIQRTETAVQVTEEAPSKPVEPEPLPIAPTLVEAGINTDRIVSPSPSPIPRPTLSEGSLVEPHPLTPPATMDGSMSLSPVRNPAQSIDTVGDEESRWETEVVEAAKKEHAAALAEKEAHIRELEAMLMHTIGELKEVQQQKQQRTPTKGGDARRREGARRELSPDPEPELAPPVARYLAPPSPTPYRSPPRNRNECRCDDYDALEAKHEKLEKLFGRAERAFKETLRTLRAENAELRAALRVGGKRHK